jgi:protein involved in polysaccharide export with SLBB domain
VKKPVFPGQILSAARRYANRVLCGLAIVMTLSVVLLGEPPALAQSLPDAAVRLLRHAGGSGGGGDGDDSGQDEFSIKPDVKTFTPAGLPTTPPPSSRLEELYSFRATEPLRQFGYDALGVPQAVSIIQAGAVPDNYVLGYSDELVVMLRGQENDTYRSHVDRDGRVTFPKFTPILAAGRRFGDVRADLEAQVAHAYVSTQIFVSLGNIHQVSVLVAGEVRNPGVRTLSGLGSPLDAILLSGGIKKTGSLRNVKIINGTTTRTIDLYSVVAQGRNVNLGTLHDGDRIFVPTLGQTAAVAGTVSRPAIYELAPGSSGIRVSELLRLAGGSEIAGEYRLSKIGLNRGALALAPTSPGGLVRSGEVLVVSGSHGGLTGRIWVRGEVAYAGLRPLSLYHNVSDVFRSMSDLMPDAYAQFAIIRRRDAATNSVLLIPFSITAAIRHEHDIPLQNDDSIIVLSRPAMVSLAAIATQDDNKAYAPADLSAIQTGGGRRRIYIPPPTTTALATPDASPGVSRALAALGAKHGIDLTTAASSQSGADAAATGSLSPGGSASTAGEVPSDTSAAGSGASSPDTLALSAESGFNRVLQNDQLTDDQAVALTAQLMDVSGDALVRLASDNVIWVLNEVREPGPYLAASGTTFSDMLLAAGGVQKTADLSAIEVTSTEIDQLNGVTHTSRQSFGQRDPQMMAMVRAKDVIRLRSVYSDRDQGSVTVAGEVRFPGSFDITRDERLSSLLQRAGGVTEVAYPYGAIFTRRSAALSEKQGYDRSARELESQIPLLLAAQTQGDASQTTTATYLSTLAGTLRTSPALGRVVITADPTVLATKPELDFVLQPGDTLFVPKRPSDVTVSGEVLNTGSFQYRAGLHYADYVRLAGGTTQSADDGRTFIVLPDGSASPADSGLFSFGSGGNIPPGSTIVVPRDISPFNWSQFLKDASQIVSQLAITAASLSVLDRNQ